MHELSLARDLLCAAERNFGARKGKLVRVNVGVGSAAGIELDSLRLAFRVLVQGTRFDGAELSVTSIAALSRCTDCCIIFEFEDMIGHCPRCGRLGGELLCGDEMVLRAIEVTDV